MRAITKMVESFVVGVTTGLVVGTVCLTHLQSRQHIQPDPTEQVIIEQVEVLLRDSIRVTDTILVKIKDGYKKDSIVIIEQSVTDDIEFFSNYLSETAE